MLYGVKAPGKGLLVKQLRELVAQLDAAGVHDDAVVRGRVNFGNKVRELTVESGERLYQVTQERVDQQNGKAPADPWFDPASIDSGKPKPVANPDLIGPADPR
jgi:hypothetical protein